MACVALSGFEVKSDAIEDISESGQAGAGW